MFGRYDPRDEDGRNRSGSYERHRGSRGGGDRDGIRDDDDRHALGRGLDLPRGRDRELVRHRNRSHELNGPESEALARIGAFRVVHADDLREVLDPDRGERAAPGAVRHLQESGLLERIPLESRSRDVVVLTRSGRDLLESNRGDRDHEPCQIFYAGLRKPRELTHDAQVYRAFCRADERLRDGGARVRRLVLDYELKREYQQFLQERNRGQGDSDGRPDRDASEIARWAREHDLPFFDGSVHFPDCRIEYEDRDGRSRHEDLEVVTDHYRGAHGASAATSGFRCYRAGGLSGGSGRAGRGRAREARLAEEFL